MKEFKLPDVGEGLTEAEIVRWHVKPGDPVAVNQIIVEIETAKAVVELPCPFEGVVAALMAGEGETVDVGTPIISVDDGTGPGSGPSGAEATSAPVPAGIPATAGSPADDMVPAPPQEKREPVLVGYGVKPGAAKRRPRKAAASPGAAPASSGTAVPPGQSGTAGPSVSSVPSVSSTPSVPSGVPGAVALAGAPAPVPRPVAGAAGRVLVAAKPPVRKLAKDLGVDLSTLTGTGPHGSITRDDVHAAVTAGRTGAPAPSAPQDEERIPVKGVRKATAQAMVASAFTAPHVTEFLQVDVTGTMEAVRRLREMPDFAEVKVSPLLLVAKAVLVAARRYPMVNSTWDEARQEIVVKHRVNLGIAAATPRGLLVPNVKDAHALSLPDLARELKALTEAARAGRTQPADMAQGTITITNVGVFGVDAGTPILNPGESAILAFGQIRDMPWVVDGQIVPRKVCTLALSFDHRIVDGELGSLFLRDIGAMLEDPLRMLAWS
ncbi:pyruvate dehydrogenase E2 component (dihydrolipoamide acetyltransferase) [Streptosporangium becharense]|uniref:Dihydrolipoamide acetyltransferase component of pyruvate dehydrogenase complex n=1 Tax=Streptosporangium becharense TaxID=1816182 RepID=A0A7W9MHC5_9ACTN|nr:dihydrolipoamide acetyltransferase family protein [Streptosporangium becharense]MBB2912376.1 pyruvate dehydrogenase E2 component (dihydrolipoamide acetyltransferase) [Streptosporangium becharense]MBB5820795.1 pyruvate dehydrogenase E2 component (dihydrolipoamide acetyltransferase) [Streptosporangium becharense]